MLPPPSLRALLFGAALLLLQATALRAEPAASSPAPLELSSALRTALDNSPELRQLRARLAEADHRREEVWAPARPSLTLEASVNHLTPPLSLEQGGARVTVNESQNYQVALNLSQVLATFGRLEWSAEAERLGRIQAEEQYRGALEGLIEQVTRAYIQAALAAQEAAQAREQVAARRAHLEEAERLLAAGSVARYDVLRSRSELSRSEQTLLEAEAAQALRAAELESLMGWDLGGTLAGSLGPPPARTYRLPAPIAPPPDEPACQAAWLRARSRHPDLTAIFWAVEAARARARRMASEDNPTLAWQSSASQRNSTAFVNPRQWSTTLQLSVPLHDGGASRLRELQALEVVKQLEASLVAAERAVTLRIHQIRQELRTGWARIEVARQEAEEAEEAGRIARIRYGAGISTQVELLDAANAVARARLEEARVRASYLQAQAAWRRATSGEYPVEVPGPLGPLGEVGLPGSP